MVERSYSIDQLVEIIRIALARRLGRTWNLADGFDLATAFSALCNLLRHSRAEASLVDGRMDHDAIWAAVSRPREQRWAETYPILRAAALAILRAVLAPTGPFTTIPKLGRIFHIRIGRDGGIEIVTNHGTLAGRDIVLQLRVDRGAVPQELIDELDREACATLAAQGKRLMQKARAAFIRERLAENGRHLAQRTIENKLKAR